MKTNKTFGGIMAFLTFTLFTGVVGNLEAQSTRGDTWPPATVLNTYGLTGMALPREMSRVEWNVEADSDTLHIRYSGTQNTLTAIKNWFVSNGWTLYADESRGRDIKIGYRKVYAVDEEEGDEYFYKTEIVFDGSMGYIRSTKD